MKIRKENPGDYSKIHQLTADAFAPMAFSDGTEPAVIDNLRSLGELSLSLVADIDGSVVGHVAFSPVVIGESAEGWYGLGPVSVKPELQRQGIGSAIINDGLRHFQDNGAYGCALIGDPNYYSRFGFVSDGTVLYEDLPSKHVQWLAFGDQRPEGILTFSRAFDSDFAEPEKKESN